MALAAPALFPPTGMQAADLLQVQDGNFGCRVPEPGDADQRVADEGSPEATRPTGTMILSGLHEESSTMPAADMIRREITAKGSFGYTAANFAAALDLLAHDKISLDPWIIEAPLDEGGKWFERLIESPGNVSKVLLVPEM